VAAMTGNLGLSEAPGNVLVEAVESGLPRDSVVNVSQLATLDKGYLGELVGSLGTRTMLAVDDGLRTALAL
jgi:mRNA interferase MazF